MRKMSCAASAAASFTVRVSTQRRHFKAGHTPQDTISYLNASLAVRRIGKVQSAKGFLPNVLGLTRERQPCIATSVMKNYSTIRYCCRETLQHSPLWSRHGASQKTRSLQIEKRSLAGSGSSMKSLLRDCKSCRSEAKADCNDRRRTV